MSESWRALMWPRLVDAASRGFADGHCGKTREDVPPGPLAERVGWLAGWHLAAGDPYDADLVPMLAERLIELGTTLPALRDAARQAGYRRLKDRAAA